MLNIRNMCKSNKERVNKEKKILSTSRLIDEAIKAIKENDEKKIEKIINISDISVKSDTLHILFSAALECDNINIIKILIKKENDILEKELMRAVENGNISVIKKLIKYGANVNYTNDKLQTPLHIAMGISNSEVVKLLVENNANISAKDVMGRTPIF